MVVCGVYAHLSARKIKFCIFNNSQIPIDLLWFNKQWVTV